MPFGTGSGVPSVAKSIPAVRPFISKPFTYEYSISGVTKNSTGVILGGCTVYLFQTSNNVLQATITSDANGNYRFGPRDTTTLYYVVAYKVGAPDVAGTTVNTLIGK